MIAMKNKLISFQKMRGFFSVLTSVVLLFIIISYFYTGLYKNASLTVLIGLIVLSFLLLNIIIWRVTSSIYKRLLQQKDFELKKNELKNAILFSEELTVHEESIYKIHHDMKNHLGVVYSMLEDGQQSEALEYTEKVRQSLKSEIRSC